MSILVFSVVHKFEFEILILIPLTGNALMMPKNDEVTEILSCKASSETIRKIYIN